MVKRQLVSYSYTCDVCGGAISDGDSATRKISWEGTAYVVDVCDDHGSLLSDLLTQLKSFVDAGTRTTGRRGRRPAAVAASTSRATRGTGASAAGSSPKRGDLSAVRAWARESGMKVSERGRIPGDLLAAYDAANNGSPAPEAASAESSAAPSAPAADASSTVTATASRAPRTRRASATAKKASATKSSGSAKRGDLGAVRAWARENGRTVNERGRVSADLLAAYDAANDGGSAPAPAPARARVRRPRKAATAAS